MSTPNLESTLKQLRLSGMAGTISLRLQEAAANRLSHEEFLEIILQDELNVRQERLLSRRTKAADSTASKHWRILTGALIPASRANRSTTWPPASSFVSPPICY